MQDQLETLADWVFRLRGSKGHGGFANLLQTLLQPPQPQVTFVQPTPQPPANDIQALVQALLRSLPPPPPPADGPTPATSSKSAGAAPAATWQGHQWPTPTWKNKPKWNSAPWWKKQRDGDGDGNKGSLADDGPGDGKHGDGKHKGGHGDGKYKIDVPTVKAMPAVKPKGSDPPAEPKGMPAKSKSADGDGAAEEPPKKVAKTDEPTPDATTAPASAAASGSDGPGSVVNLEEADQDAVHHEDAESEKPETPDKRSSGYCGKRKRKPRKDGH